MIRTFKKGDQKVIAQIENECFSSPWSETAISETIENGGFYTVFEQDGKIVGYAGLQIVLDEGYITNVAVTKEYRGRGIGSALLESLKIIALEKGLRFISLEVRRSNNGAIALYKKHGFKQVGERRNFYLNPTEDAIIMTLEGNFEC